MNNEATSTTILRPSLSKIIPQFDNRQSHQKSFQDWEATFKDGFGGGANGTIIFDNPYKNDPQLRLVFINAREARRLYRTSVADDKPEPVPNVHTPDDQRPIAEQPGQHVNQKERQSISHILNSPLISEQQAQRVIPEEAQSASDTSTRAHVDFTLPDSTVNAGILNVPTQDGAEPSCSSIETHTDLSKAGQKSDFAHVIDLTGSDEEAASEEQRPAKKRKLRTRLRTPKV
ncbi:hypothetical protein FLAG1_08538 [Fusarium langsethiae]|uniref:Uncharacterized protein n=1 Tax=Fusarium langsethiae TaxID=179993 RepID=A0A0N0DCS7_FUSLA|nr:hypothetical protein FLAG1_08538 [Fusarium langsethiae]